MTKVLGLLKLNRKLERLPEAAKAEIRKAMEKAANQMVKMMRSLVPVDRGDLRDSIGWRWGGAPRGSTAVAVLRGAGVGQQLTLTIYAGDNRTFYAIFQEFGTEKMAASPFFFVSYRANRKSARVGIARAVKKSARKVAAG